MELFNIFRDTIFLKEDSDLDKQLAELKNIKNKLDNTEEIDKDIKLLEWGIQGEKEIDFELRNANIGMYVIHDITFEYNGNKAQIDYLLFTRGKYYLIECKNLYGNVTVDSTGQFYREYEYKGKKIKEAIYSPYTQAVRHQDMMKNVWSINHNKIDNFLYRKLLDKLFFKPIVVLANSKGILNTKYAPKDIKDNVIRVDQLISYIKKDIASLKKDELSSQKGIKESAETWLSRSIKNDSNIASKYYDKIKNNDEYLENKLKQFRKVRSTKMNIPAYYIFTDEEMNNIIKYMPKTIEALKEKKILPDIKIKCHGKEIIELINNSEV